MKNHVLNNIILLLLTVIFLNSCSEDNYQNTQQELNGLELVNTVNQGDHQISLYTESGKLSVGFNEIYLKIESSNQQPISNYTATWTPIMQMHNMSHSCPKSDIQFYPNFPGLSSGFIIFQMPSNTTESWEIQLSYQINQQTFNTTVPVEVLASDEQNVSSFLGSDNQRYVLAKIDPKTPRVGMNNITTALFKMDNMLQFSTVENYSIQLDPRMPGMGNHSSPNNQDLLSIGNGFYSGNLSLTMTGYWKLNLILKDAENQIIKGEPVTEENESSSLYFELEF